MNDDTDFPILGSNIDKSQVPSIHQKRLLAFVNHFIINTVTFLNQFIANCETKFIEVETKIQNVESALIIVEAKLGSISGIGEQSNKQDTPVDFPISKEESVTQPAPVDASQVTSDTVDHTEIDSNKNINVDGEIVAETITTNENDQLAVPEPIAGVKACEDYRYKKYFKMIQFGVPSPAVKLKMEADGFDSSILDEPNRILEDGQTSSASEEA